MITECDAESSRRQQHSEHSEVEAIYAKIPYVQRHCRECENKRADQERTGGPVNAVNRNAKNQGAGIFRRISPFTWRVQELRLPFSKSERRRSAHR